ncbi:cytochrome P450 302a1, mitochondrial [Trichonephila clavipes]|uniref:Cytochrome P450 302a1, mitochondrial n=1 Tax=Trichonephila clavipes TaxID=2585209 RepID=A0A8X6VKR1_TRICX|nr:cytochrome P450 302a1, mitochondrial [Trichonephila clavipes]
MCSTYRNSLCCLFLTWSREHALWTPQQWSCVMFSDESRFSLQSDSRRILIWIAPGTRYHQENTIERHRYGGAGWLVWGGTILGSRTDLHVQSVTKTGHIYRDVILEQHVRLFRGAMGAEFLFMHNNAHPHHANIVDECLQSEDITRMDWPAYSPDLNPKEHVWDMLGRRIAARQPPPTCLPELRRALLDEWCNIPQDQIDNLILSMLRRCFGLIAFNRRLNALSEKVNKETDALIHSARQTNETIFLGNVCDLQRQYKRLIPVQDYFSKVLVTYMLEAVCDPDRDCLLNRLLEKGHDEKDVVTVMLDMFQGAISGIPLTLTWALYHLSYSPDIFIQSRAREELIEILPNKDSRYYELNKPLQEYLFMKSRAPCVQAILRETLRLIPPTIGIGRINREDLILGGYLVPAGNMIILQSQAACRLEEYFEHPLKFVPSRFMNLKEFNPELKINFPFGLGHRACVGFSFAHAQMIMALSKPSGERCARRGECQNKYENLECHCRVEPCKFFTRLERKEVGVPVTAHQNVWFTYDGVPAHFLVLVRNHLHATYSMMWTGCSGSVAWPPCSPDVNPRDFFFGHLKSLVYETPVATVDDLPKRIAVAQWAVFPIWRTEIILWL